MFAQEDPKQPGKREQIVMAVTIAALSTLASGLVHWGIEELKLCFGSKPKEQDKDNA